MKSFIKRFLPWFFVLPWTFIYFYYVTLGNLEFIHQAYALTVDELGDLVLIAHVQNSFRSVFSFLQTFFWQNPDPSHGFILYSVPAIVSYFPKLIWGEHVVIFIHRMLSAILLYGSLLILSFGVIRNRLLGLLLFFFLMGIPYINVFSFWPRCESYLYFFLALFLYFQVRTNFRSVWAYFFLALGVSARPSIAFYLPFLLLLPCLFVYQQEGKIYFFTYCKKVFLALLGGVSVAQPHFIFPSNILQFINNHLYLLQAETGVRDYVNAQWWFQNIVSFYFPVRFYLSSFSHFLLWLLGFYSLLGFASMSADFRSYFKKKKDIFLFWLLIHLSSIASLLFVFFKVQKGVGWYLQLYFILLFVSSFWLIGEVTKKLRWSRLIFYPSLMLYCCFYFSQQFPWSPYFRMEYSIFEMRVRSQTEYHKNLQNEFDRTKMILERMAKEVKRPLRVRIMAEQYQIPSTEYYQVNAFWYPGPFYMFDERLDVLIFYKELYRPENPLNRTETGELHIRRESVENYLKLVRQEWGGKCQKDCFSAFPITDELYLFYREKNFPNKAKVLQLLPSL